MKHFVLALCALIMVSFAVIAQEPNWNQFRGPKSDNRSASTGIAKTFPDGGPKLLWKIDTLGRGFSPVSFHGDIMYTMGDLDSPEAGCYAIALNRKTGDIIWRTRIARNGGDPNGPLTSPACDGENVYVFGQFGDFVALDAKTGEIRWRTSVQELGGGKMAGWDYSSSPIIDGDKILLSVGGDRGTLAAFDKTGKVLWRSVDLKDPTAYSSPVPVEIAGVKQYLLLTGKSIAGISPADGKVLWRGDFPGDTAVCSDPVLCGDVVMASCGYGVGAYFYRISKEGDTFKAERFRSPSQGNTESHHGGFLAFGDHFYVPTQNNIICVEAKTGTIVWQNRGVGKGSCVFVDGKLILRSEGGEGLMAIIEATPEGYKQLARFEQPDRSNRNSWTHPVVADKKLFIRDQGLLLCYDLE
jgi:outer membrane protein assembly factor BamB